MSTKLLIGATCTNTYWTSKTIHQCHKSKFSKHKSWKPLQCQRISIRIMWLLKRKAEADWEILFLNKCSSITHSHTDRETPAITIVVWGETHIMYIYCCYCHWLLHCTVSCADDEFFLMSWDRVYFHLLQYFPVHRWSKMHLQCKFYTPVQLMESDSQGYQHTSFPHYLLFGWYF